jgi:hypothetical protein
MKATFSRQQWVEYTCGAAPLELKFAMDDHIGRCHECAAISGSFEDIERELMEAVGILRESVPELEWRGERAYELWRNERPRPVAEDGPALHLSQRIVRLQLFLAPICGFGTAQRAMLAAAGRSTVDSIEVLTELEWPGFVQHLSSIVGALCGEPAGWLLWHIGQPIPVEVL